MKFSISPKVQRSGYNQALAAAGEKASRHLPPGYRAELESGYRPGDHGMHGSNRATDFGIYDAEGHKLPWYQDPEQFRTYEKFHQDIHRALPPEERARHRWGGYFGGSVPGTYGAMDLMHSDLGGPGRMAAGSWAHGLNPEYRHRWRVQNSQGME